MRLNSYRRKGLNAYLVRADRPLTEAIYGTPIPGDEEKAHKGKLHTVEINEAELADGTYRYKEAGGADFNKARYGWVEIKAGQIISEGEGDPPSPNAEFMPELEGSDKQIAWAESIRAKASAKHGSKLAKYIAEQRSAKWWIDNRQKLGVGS